MSIIYGLVWCFMLSYVERRIQRLAMSTNVSDFIVLVCHHDVERSPSYCPQRAHMHRLQHPFFYREKKQKTYLNVNSRPSVHP